MAEKRQWSWFVLDMIGTIREHFLLEGLDREERMMWMKDAAAGVVLVVFMACAFALPSLAHAAF